MERWRKGKSVISRLNYNPWIVVVIFCFTISQVMVLSKTIGFGCISASRILIAPVCFVRQFEVVTSEFCFRNAKISRTKTQCSFV
jgi:hypothetical protein